MAGGRNVPDIGVQHPSNQNMMQMDNAGTKGVNLPNSPDVPQGIQNPAHPTQPGTAITQPSQPGQPYNNQPNQVNPNTQPNAPGSPQHTPLQNNTRTVLLDEKLLWHKQPDTWDVNINDNKGGHIKIRHLVSRDTLLKRSSDLGEFKTYHYFSSFKNEEILTRSVRYGLKENVNEIDNWLIDVKQQIELTTKTNKKIPSNFRLLLEVKGFPEPIGFGLARGTKNFENLYNMRMILETKGDGVYYIFTAYPIR